jgi:NACHT domain
MPDVCEEFPELPQPLVERPHFLSLLDDLFEGRNHIVTVEGEEGRGKTTLAAQFALSHADRAVSLFISAAGSFARSPEYLITVLCDQIHWFFKGVRRPSGDSPEQYLRSACLQLQRTATLTGKPFYFVVDGLLQLAHEDPDLVPLVLTDYLPVGVPNFKFLITGDKEALPEALKRQSRQWKPPGFSPDEVKQLLGGFGLSEHVIKEVANTFSGVPGPIASIRRSLSGGLSPQELESDMPRTLRQLLQVEWRVVDSNNVLQSGVLGLLAFAKHTLTLNDIARALQVTAQEVRDAVAPLHFVIAKPEVGSMSYVSNALKDFAAKQFQDHRQGLTEKLLALLTADSRAVNAAEHIPEYLDALGRPRELARYLNLDHLGTICESTHSLQPARRALKHGFDSAFSAGEQLSAFQFALEREVISDLGSASVLTSEIEAYLALGERSRALSLVQGALLKEDRFEGLSKIVSKSVEQGEPADAAILAELRRLAPEVDFSSSPDRAISIGSGLIGCLPEVAIELVELATKENSEYPQDVGYAALAIAARDASRQQVGGAISDESITERINNPDIRSITRTLSAVVGEYSVDEILRRAEEMTSTHTCLSLLEKWTSSNTDHPDGFRVLHYGLQRMLRTSDYSMDCRTLRRLAAPLPSTADSSPHEANKLLLTIDAQKAILEANGPSVEYVRLNILLIETEALWAPDSGLGRTEQLCYFIAGLEPDLRAEALAWLIAALARDRYGRLQNVASTLSATLRADFASVVHDLLLSTADHFEALRRVARALISADPLLLADAIQKVNTRDRRDLLTAYALSHLRSAEIQRLGVDIVQRLVSSIFAAEVRDRCVVRLAVALNDRKHSASLDSSWLPLLQRALSIDLAPLKAVACAHAMAICSRMARGDVAEPVERFSNAASVALGAVNSDWDKTDVGFEIAAVLAVVDPERARSLVADSHKVRRRSLIPDGRTAVSYVDAARLAIRAFVGLVPRQLDLEESYVRLRKIINCIPSEGVRATLWSNLALRCFSWQHTELATRIVNEEIRPVLTNISDPGFRAMVLQDVAPSLYSAHPASAVRELATLDEAQHGAAFSHIISYILTKQPSGEPLPYRYVSKDIVRKDVDDIVQCLTQISSDKVMGYAVEQISKHVCSPESRYTFSRAERIEIARQIEEATKGKLPWASGIRHSGYFVVVMACLLQMRDATRAEWDNLAEAARQIDNVADRVLVISSIANHAPARFDEFRRNLVSEARVLSSSIGSPIDRLDRLELLAARSAPFDKQQAKLCLSDAFRMSAHVKQDTTSQQRAIIDLADRIDEEFAKSLISEMEADPAIRKQQVLGRRNKVRRVLRDLALTTSSEAIMSLTPEETAELCELMLQGLHDGTVVYFPVQRIGEFIAHLPATSFRKALRVIEWMIENSVRTHALTPFGTTHLVQLFGACAAACELGSRLLSRSAGYQYETAALSELALDSDDVETIGPGDRQRAIQMIYKWIQNVGPCTIKICDPYFGPDDLELVRLILQAAPECNVKILTGESKQRELDLRMPYDESYAEKWRAISQHNPPRTDIVVAGLVSTHLCPIHERWILGNGQGLRLGSSFSGLGVSRVSEISVLSESSAQSRVGVLDEYLACRVRDSDGIRIRYFSFSL